MKSKKFFRLKQKMLAKAAEIVVEAAEVVKEELKDTLTLPEIVVESQEETLETVDKKKVTSKKK